MITKQKVVRIELSADGLSFLKVNGERALLTLFSSAWQFHHNRKHCIFHIEIYIQHKK